jgi:exodeoxyribonuclease VII small subunit
MSKILTYAEAIVELETIVSDIENASIGVDELSEKVKRAAELIKLCRAKLNATTSEVNAILAGIEEKPASE